MIDKSLKDYGDLKVESIINTLEPISRISFDSYIGTNNATLTKVVSDFKKELNEYDKKYSDVTNDALF